LPDTRCMSRRVIVLISLFALALPVTAAAGASWVHWKGHWFSAWVPNDAWQVVEGQNNLNISSPTGSDIVTYQYATNAPAPVTPLWVASQVFRYQNQDLHPLSNVRVIGRSAVSTIPGGGQRQVFEWTGVRHDADRASEAVRGTVIAESFANEAIGAYGYDTYAKAAPQRLWRARRAQLEYIRAHMSFYGVSRP
jgi:hypothetical protein